MYKLDKYKINDLFFKFFNDSFLFFFIKGFRFGRELVNLYNFFYFLNFEIKISWV